MSKPLFRFHKTYFLLAIILFLAEVFIAIYIDDRIVRPYGGDFLVVILIYCFFRSFLDVPVVGLAISVLIFSYVIEMLQYVKIVKWLGLQHSTIAKTVIGTSFQWIDLVAYTLGIVVVIAIERLRQPEARSSIPPANWP